MISARHLPLVLLALPLATPALAQAPEVIPYQGYLTDADGAPVDGNVRMTFRMYDGRDDANPTWEEVWGNVPVDDGVFVVYLGQNTPIVDGVNAGEIGYLGIEIANDGEAQPRQKVGSVPYALFARDSYYLRGQSPDSFVTEVELDARQYIDRDEVVELIAEGGGGEIDLDGYVTDDELAAALAGLGDTYVSVEQLETYINEAELAAALGDYLTADDLDGYVTDAELAAALAGLDFVTDADLAVAIADFLTEADLAVYLEVNEYMTRADVAAYLENNNYVQDADLDALRVRIETLERQIAAVADGGLPYLLGRSAQTSAGRFSFQNRVGIQAANRMCEVSFPNDPTAHFCSADEVMVAIAKGRYDANNAGAINASTWTVAEIGRSQARNANNSLEVSCQGLMYNSADVANGTELTVNLSYTSPGNGGGLTGPIVQLRPDVACGQNKPVFCCR
ncbi:MAG: hypothetical protein R3F65_15780 [bacterium]|nr:hypothetical protein [Myxococcales bacterium]MCB9543969.1 hypothetical protein [Myxococcales bacterium]MCB9552130.1 hypothetical protein [Myxococcales bacterium]